MIRSMLGRGALALCLTLLAGGVCTAKDVGQVISFKAGVTAQRDGQAVALDMKSPVGDRDTLTTDATGRAQILFDDEGDLPVQFRYFDVGTGGFSSLEHHQHMHAVLIGRGRGHALLGEEIREVAEGDFITIPSWQWHQFRADCGEPLGFFCLVRSERDIPKYPSEEELKQLKSLPGAECFFKE